MDVSSTDTNSSLHHQLYGYGMIATDMTYRGSQNQLLERQVFFFIDGSFCI
jgi:hypothetical protein